MADDPDERQWYTVGSVKLNRAKMREVVTFTMLPDDMLKFIGHVVAVWNDFENQFNDMLARLVAANESDPEDLKRLRGKKLRKRFVHEATLQFKSYPRIVRYAHLIRNDANELARKRNSLVHGRLEFEMRIDPDQSQHHSITAYGEETFRFDYDGLEDLVYAIANLSGRMMLMLDPPDMGAWLPSPDKQRLRDFLAQNPRSQTILAKLQLPPSPSPE